MRTLTLMLAAAAVFTATAADAQSPRRAIDSILAPYDRHDAPGLSVAVVQNGKVIYQRALGLADVEANRAATVRTNYRLASVTKQFTAMAVMLLVRDGKLDYDRPVAELLPELPAYARPVTVRHLLNHTGGLPDYEDLIPAGQTAQVHDRDVPALLARADTPYFAPGTRYRYSNTGYALLALLVERAAGVPFARVLHDRIFEPSGMRATVAFEEGVSTVPERAYGYTPDTGAGAPRRFRRTDQSTTSAVLGDGGIYSSVTDLVAWDRALAAHTLLDERAYAPALAPPALPAGARTQYGFGWFVDSLDGRPRTNHTGTTVGFRNAIERFPAERLTVIVLANRTDVRALDVADAVARAVLGARSPAAAPEGAERWSNDALRRELLAMEAADQAVRAGMTAASFQDTAFMRRMMRTDSAHDVRMREIVRRYGWPTSALVGRRAARAAWLIVQHADDALQRDALQLIETTARADVLPRDLAMLTDRVLTHSGKPQRYGTQFHPEGDTLVADPVEDLPRLDERRATVGLPPMTEYVKMLAEMYKGPVAWPPKSAQPER